MWNDFKIIRVMGVITIKRILIDAVLCIFQRDSTWWKYKLKIFLRPLEKCITSNQRDVLPVHVDDCGGDGDHDAEQGRDQAQAAAQLDQSGVSIVTVSQSEESITLTSQPRRCDVLENSVTVSPVTTSWNKSSVIILIIIIVIIYTDIFFGLSSNKVVITVCYKHFHGIRMRLFDFDLLFASGC